MTEQTANTDVEQLIRDQIKSNAVILYMKGTPQFPQCGFSGKVIQILTALEAEFVTVDVLSNDQIREGIKQYSNWPTLPQLYVKGEFIGGCDIITEMYESGELKDVFAA